MPLTALRRRNVLTIFLLAITSACSSRGALGGRFVIEPAPSRGDFANDAPIVRKADAQITELLGHPVSFHFSAALLPRWDAQLEVLSAAAIDAVAHELVEIKRITPELFTWMAPELRRVEWDYSAVDEHAHYTFDPKTHTLRIVLTSAECCIVEEDRIRFAVGRARAVVQGAHFSGTTANSVSPNERGAYASWLLGGAYEAEAKAHPPKDDDQAVDRPRAQVLLEVLRFREAIQGQEPELEAKLKTKLVEEASYLAHTRREVPDIVARLPKDHPFLRAEAAYVAWLERNEATLPDQDRLKIAEEILSSTEADGSVRAFAGFDFVGHFLRVFEAWVKSGAPTKAARDDDRARQELVELVVTPLELGTGEGTSCHGSGSPVYKRLASDPAARRRVFDAVSAKHDPRVTKMMMARLVVVDVDTAIAFWHASEPDEAAFRATTRVIAGNARCSSKSRVFYDALPEMWRKYPARRGLLAFAARRFRTVVGSADGDFVKTFGPLTSAELAATLDEEEDPLAEVPQLWSSLGRGWSRMDVLEPRLDRWLAAERYKTDTSWTQSVRAVATNLCTEHATSDLARLHAWIAQRVRAHASERGVLEAASALSAPNGCLEGNANNRLL